MNKKYELTAETKVVFGVTLHRIKAIVDFELKCGIKINAGDLGGWIEKEENLDQSGNAWVYGNARVYGDAWVYGNARVSGNAWVYGDARVSGDAWVYGNARVSGDAWVYGNARVYKQTHWLSIGPIGSRFGFTTFFRTENCEIFVSCGCFLGNIDTFLEKVQKTHGDNKHAIAYRAAAEIAKGHIDLS